MNEGCYLEVPQLAGSDIIATVQTCSQGLLRFWGWDSGRWVGVAAWTGIQLA